MSVVVGAHAPAIQSPPGLKATEVMRSLLMDSVCTAGQRHSQVSIGVPIRPTSMGG
jgi:hypothetical protein